LESEGWKELTLERSYGIAEGFSANWPSNLTFDEIEEKYKQAHPKEDLQRDDLILMVLWISGTLPKE
jgi:hypothetical protein